MEEEEREEPFAFQPGAGHLADSNVARFMKKHDISGYKELVEKANGDISWYWDAVNDDLGLEWFQKYDNVYDSSSAGVPWTKWFVGGKCNIVANAIDRHAKKNPDKIAYIFANERSTRKVTYGELDLEVGRLASALLDAGIKKGDVVGIYLPMVPEAFFAIFACSKIGAVHTTVFSGFSAPALRSRLVDSGARLLITADSAKRRGKDIDLKAQWSQAIEEGTKVERVVTVGGKSAGSNNIVNYGDFVQGKGQARTEVMDAEDPLFILYTSGTTGQPKGTLQVHGGFMAVAAQQAAYLIDLKPDDVLFWYADIGWITGQVWVVYGSPIVGATALVYEEALDYPAPDIWCRLVEKHRVSIFGAAPTAIRLFMKSNVNTDSYDLSSLRVLACTGEPINREAWNWYFDKVGRKKCPVINLSGGTEIGGAILSALPVMPLRPCTVGCPIPGFDADVLDESGRPASEGLLVIKKPWPSMSRGILNDPARFIETYWSRYGKNVWYHGDIVLVDSDGLWYMRGRADDVIKVSGHRIGTAEVEAAAASHPAVAEAVAVGRPDDLKGEIIVICAVIKDGHRPDEGLKSEIAKKVEEAIGRFARPDEVRLVPELPKTRTGKLVRRLVRAKVAGESMSGQDVSTVENPHCLDLI
ncbi:acyl-CoA synthetase/AMP-acid ligase [Candidatus Nitrososphaera evergladensis SR1]|uniref:acetate--CoA ligase n=1 Tax=Candidatus Nitrososphaera evergladensis SR1 TaxID=1459636 RepID=A0A075MM14_9ARCH|nr:acetate--CoA ligase [Candidatus Nitrososphaera evergladensis]AIF82526.1 acyl-CoA synthetase/AMP-acid ligase [Candidatus Nitrososphaera evergladensis SR1]